MRMYMTGQRIGLITENSGRELVAGKGDGTEIVPAQASGQSQIRLNLEAVLNEEAIEGLA